MAQPFLPKSSFLTSQIEILSDGAGKTITFRSHSLHVLTLGWFALLLCGLCLACIVPRSAFAVPAAPWAQTAVQPDGSTVTYRVYGDEDFSYYATEGGLLLQRDPETKALCFVEGDPESGYVLGASASDAVAATDRYAVVDDLGSQPTAFSKQRGHAAFFHTVACHRGGLR